MITKEQADKAREIVAGLGEEEKKQFLEKYSSLDADKKQIVIGRLVGNADALKSKNNVDLTYETPKPQQVDPGAAYLSGVKERTAKSDASIATRGTLADLAKKSAADISSPDVFRKGFGLLEAASIPSKALQAGISNPALLMQQGDFNPGRLLKETALGLTGQKLGEYGDVYRNATPGVAGRAAGIVGGLTLDIAGPLRAFKAARSTFGDVSKLGDRALLKAGQNVQAAANAAEQSVGKEIGKAYEKLDGTLVDGRAWTDVVSKLPKALKEEATRILGDVDTLSPTIGNLRKIRTLIGKFRPGNFGRDARGLAENIEVEKLNGLYGSTKTVITNTLAKSIGAKNASKLLDMEDAAHDVYKASDFIKSATVDPKLLLPTRAGRVAKGIEDSGDVSTRSAINILRRGGGREAKKLMEKAVRTLEIYNGRAKAWKTAGHVVSALTYGGAVGSVGGMLVARGLKKGEGE